MPRGFALAAFSILLMLALTHRSQATASKLDGKTIILTTRLRYRYSTSLGGIEETRRRIRIINGRVFLDISYSRGINGVQRHPNSGVSYVIGKTLDITKDKFNKNIFPDDIKNKIYNSYIIASFDKGILKLIEKHSARFKDTGDIYYYKEYDISIKESKCSLKKYVDTTRYAKDPSGSVSARMIDSICKIN